MYGRPPAARVGKNHRPPIDPWAGWGYRGDQRGTLDWVFSPIMGTGEGPSAPTATDVALLAGAPNHRRQTNRLHRQMRIGAAQRKLPRASGERVWCLAMAACSTLTSYATTALQQYSTTALPNGTHFWYYATTACGGKGKISARVPPPTGNL